MIIYHHKCPLKTPTTARVYHSHSRCLSSSSDHSGWFSGLPWWWGWGRWRRRRAVSEEATSPEFLRLIVLIFCVQGERIWSHSPSSGWLIGPWRACAIILSSVRRRLKLRPWLTAPPPHTSSLGLFLFHGSEWKNSPGNHLLFLVFYTDPWPTASSWRSQSTLRPLPFHPSSLSVFCFPISDFRQNSCHRRHLVCTDRLQFLLKTSALQRLPVLLCCYSNRSKEAAFNGNPARTLVSWLALSPSILLEPELMGSRDEGNSTTSQCTNCSAGQSG